jgi:hypothetical protein
MSDREIRESEIEVQKSTAEFDQAMKHLEEAIEDSGQKVATAVETAQEIVQRPVRKMKAIRERVRKASTQSRDVATEYSRMTRAQARRYYRQAQDSIGPIVQDIRGRPELLRAIFGVFAFGFVSAVFLSKQKSKASSQQLSYMEEPASIVRSERLEDQVVQAELTDLNKRAA